jgi:MFS family permease
LRDLLLHAIACAIFCCTRSLARSFVARDRLRDRFGRVKAAVTKGIAVNATDAGERRAAPTLPYRQLTLLLATQLAYGTGWSTFLLMPKFLTVELHASATQIGLVSAVPSLTAALAVPFVGPLIDRIGRRPLITLGAALAVVQALAFVWVDRIGPLLLGLQLLGGLSFVLQFNAASAQAADLAPRARRWPIAPAGTASSCSPRR